MAAPPAGGMTVADARKVRWLSTDPRPLGELMDEGYLTQKRLEWAAEKAYNSTLREAAQVLLDASRRAALPAHKAASDSMPEPVPVNMTVEAARTTLWPFSELRGQTFGALLDNKRLSLKDLGYAADNAKDKRVRDAAVTLTLARLNQIVQEPGEPAGHIKVVSGGRSYALRKQFELMFRGGFLIGAVGATLLTALAMYEGVLRMVPHRDFGESMAKMSAYPLYQILSIVIAVAICALIVSPMLAVNMVLNRMLKQAKNYRKGEEGEDRATGIISQVLDANWYLFRNVELPGRNKGDLDAVLLGPTGIWVLEMKAYSGAYRNIGDRWEFRAGNRWKTSRSNPGKQAHNNALRLKDFLKADGIQQWINEAVIWSGLEAPLTVENPTVGVWTLERLPEELGNLDDGKRKVSDAECQKIVEKLSKLCEKPEED